MSESTRPKRVVIVDADNPLEEVRGEFFWREDHERAVADARDVAFRDGYAQGWADASRRDSTATVRIRRRPRRVMFRALIVLAAVAFAVELIADMVR